MMLGNKSFRGSKILEQRSKLDAALSMIFAKLQQDDVDRSVGRSVGRLAGRARIPRPGRTVFSHPKISMGMASVGSVNYLGSDV